MASKLATNWVKYVLRERGRLQVALGIPAIAMCGLSALVYWSSQAVGPGEIAERYSKAALAAHQAGEYQTAELWLRKILQLKPGDRGARYRMALIAIENKEYDRGRRIMKELAPETRVGYGPSHLFVASQLLRDDDENDIERTERIRWHLSAALRANAHDVRARQMMAEYELLHRNVNDAIGHYAILEKGDPSVNLLLAQLYVTKGERLDAEHAAARGLRHFKTIARQEPTNIEARIEWARLEAFMENYDRAATLLSKVAAYQRVPDEKIARIRRVLADVYFSWSEALHRERPHDHDERLKLLEMALKFAPEDSRPYESLTAMREDSPALADRIDELVSRMVGADDTAPMIHLNLALAAVRDGKLDLEREHLELALKAAPRLGVAANNLAWNIATSQPDKIDLALELAGHAVECAPERPEFRATKGRILAMANRENEAIDELEVALSRLYDRPDIQETLTDLYIKRDTGMAVPENKLRMGVPQEVGQL